MYIKLQGVFVNGCDADESRYRKDSLMARFGADIALLDLLVALRFDGVMLRNHAAPWFTADCQSLSDPFLAHAQAPICEVWHDLTAGWHERAGLATTVLFHRWAIQTTATVSNCEALH